MLGNFVTGVAILGPAGMLGDLAAGLGVTVRQAGLLITFGAALLCFCSPLVVWATSALDRRLWLSLSLAALAAGHVASALAPDYASLLAIRLAMLTVAAAFTPVAAGTVAQIVPEKQRASAISFVFLGWSIAVAVGLPLITFIAAHVGWRETFAVLGLAAAAVLVLLLVSVPAGLRSPPLSLRSWGTIANSPLILLLLLISILWTSGQFVIFPFLGPLITGLTGGGPAEIGAAFAVLGAMGFLGNVAATRAVIFYGAFQVSLVFLLSLLAGAALWAVGAGFFAAMIVAVAFWGFGFAAFNSMQQARLVAAAPPLASATVALNTSSNYVGQAIGSALGAELFARGHLLAMGYADVAFTLAAMAALVATRRRR